MKRTLFDSPWFSIPFVVIGFVVWIWVTCAVPN